MHTTSSDTDKDSGIGTRPLSEMLVDLHVYRIPNDSWVPERRLAKNQAIEASISAGFIRVLPELTLQDVRKEIAYQLGYDILPSEFVFLRSIGRNFAKVRLKQEKQLKAKIFLPPFALEPELHLLEDPDNVLPYSSQSELELGSCVDKPSSRRKSRRAHFLHHHPNSFSSHSHDFHQANYLQRRASSAQSYDQISWEDSPVNSRFPPLQSPACTINFDHVSSSAAGNEKNSDKSILRLPKATKEQIKMKNPQWQSELDMDTISNRDSSLNERRKSHQEMVIQRLSTTDDAKSIHLEKRVQRSKLPLYKAKEQPTHRKPSETNHFHQKNGCDPQINFVQSKGSNKDGVEEVDGNADLLKNGSTDVTHQQNGVIAEMKNAQVTSKSQDKLGKLTNIKSEKEVEDSDLENLVFERTSDDGDTKNLDVNCDGKNEYKTVRKNIENGKRLQKLGTSPQVDNAEVDEIVEQPLILPAIKDNIPVNETDGLNANESQTRNETTQKLSTRNGKFQGKPPFPRGIGRVRIRKQRRANVEPNSDESSELEQHLANENQMKSDKKHPHKINVNGIIGDKMRITVEPCLEHGETTDIVNGHHQEINVEKEKDSKTDGNSSTERDAKLTDSHWSRPETALKKDSGDNGNEDFELHPSEVDQKILNNAENIPDFEKPNGVCVHQSHFIPVRGLEESNNGGQITNKLSKNSHLEVEKKHDEKNVEEERMFVNGESVAKIPQIANESRTELYSNEQFKNNATLQQSEQKLQSLESQQIEHDVNNKFTDDSKFAVRGQHTSVSRSVEVHKNESDTHIREDNQSEGNDDHKMPPNNYFNNFNGNQPISNASQAENVINPEGSNSDTNVCKQPLKKKISSSDFHDSSERSQSEMESHNNKENITIQPVKQFTPKDQLNQIGATLSSDITIPTQQFSSDFNLLHSTDENHSNSTYKPEVDKTVHGSDYQQLKQQQESEDNLKTNTNVTKVAIHEKLSQRDDKFIQVTDETESKEVAVIASVKRPEESLNESVDKDLQERNDVIGTDQTPSKQCISSGTELYDNAVHVSDYQQQRPEDNFKMTTNVSNDAISKKLSKKDEHFIQSTGETESEEIVTMKSVKYPKKSLHESGDKNLPLSKECTSSGTELHESENQYFQSTESSNKVEQSNMKLKDINLYRDSQIITVYSDDNPDQLSVIIISHPNDIDQQRPDPTTNIYTKQELPPQIHKSSNQEEDINQTPMQHESGAPMDDSSFQPQGQGSRLKTDNNDNKSDETKSEISLINSEVLLPKENSDKTQALETFDVPGNNRNVREISKLVVDKDVRGHGYTTKKSSSGFHSNDRKVLKRQPNTYSEDLLEHPLINNEETSATNLDDSNINCVDASTPPCTQPFVKGNIKEDSDFDHSSSPSAVIGPKANQTSTSNEISNAALPCYNDRTSKNLLKNDAKLLQPASGKGLIPVNFRNTLSSGDPKSLKEQDAQGCTKLGMPKSPQNASTSPRTHTSPSPANKLRTAKPKCDNAGMETTKSSNMSQLTPRKSRRLYSLHNSGIGTTSQSLKPPHHLQNYPKTFEKEVEHTGLRPSLHHEQHPVLIAKPPNSKQSISNLYHRRALSVETPRIKNAQSKPSEIPVRSGKTQSGPRILEKSPGISPRRASSLVKNSKWLSGDQGKPIPKNSRSSRKNAVDPSSSEKQRQSRSRTRNVASDSTNGSSLPIHRSSSQHYHLMDSIKLTEKKMGTSYGISQNQQQFLEITRSRSLDQRSSSSSYKMGLPKRKCHSDERLQCHLSPHSPSGARSMDIAKLADIDHHGASRDINDYDKTLDRLIGNPVGKSSGRNFKINSRRHKEGQQATVDLHRGTLTEYNVAPKHKKLNFYNNFNLSNHLSSHGNSQCVTYNIPTSIGQSNNRIHKLTHGENYDHQRRWYSSPLGGSISNVAYRSSVPNFSRRTAEVRGDIYYTSKRRHIGNSHLTIVHPNESKSLSYRSQKLVYSQKKRPSMDLREQYVYSNDQRITRGGRQRIAKDKAHFTQQQSNDYEGNENKGEGTDEDEISILISTLSKRPAIVSLEDLPPWLLKSCDLFPLYDDQPLNVRQLLAILRLLRVRRRKAKKIYQDYVRYLRSLKERQENYGRLEGVADMWKRKYAEELRETHILREHSRRMNQHLRLLQYETSKRLPPSTLLDPSNKASYKMAADKLVNEIEALTREVEEAKVKLATESKLKDEVENEAKFLRAEVVDRKIDAAVTRAHLQLSTNPVLWPETPLTTVNLTAQAAQL